ncbi:MAG: tetratricopeptide repeat protein [Chloroflexota bacterium]
MSKTVEDPTTENGNINDCVTHHFDPFTDSKVPLNSDAVYNFALQFVDQNCSEHKIVAAVKLMEFVADEGHLEASHTLGLIYYNGEIVPADIDKSFKYFQVAAEAGNLQSQHELGIIMLKEAKSEDDRNLALYWLGRAAYQNDGFSAYVLGMIHQTGYHGVPKDKCLALDWYDCARIMGFSDHAGLHKKLHSEYSHECN